MSCVFCENGKGEICGNCTQKLLLVSFDKILNIIEKASLEKQKALYKFFGAEKFIKIT